MYTTIQIQGCSRWQMEAKNCQQTQSPGRESNCRTHVKGRAQSQNEWAGPPTDMRRHQYSGCPERQNLQKAQIYASSQQTGDPGGPTSTSSPRTEGNQFLSSGSLPSTCLTSPPTLGRGIGFTQYSDSMLTAPRNTLTDTPRFTGEQQTSGLPWHSTGDT